MKIVISRFDPSVDTAPHNEAFAVPATPQDKWTAMDALDYIRNNLDPTIAYLRHSVCDHGICGRCAARVNGRAVLLCTCVLSDEELFLQPMRGAKVVRDLVVEPAKERAV